jgi:hypothetical protein
MAGLGQAQVEYFFGAPEQVRVCSPNESIPQARQQFCVHAAPDFAFAELQLVATSGFGVGSPVQTPVPDSPALPPLPPAPEAPPIPPAAPPVSVVPPLPPVPAPPVPVVPPLPPVPAPPGEDRGAS